MAGHPTKKWKNRYQQKDQAVLHGCEILKIPVKDLAKTAPGFPGLIISGLDFKSSFEMKADKSKSMLMFFSVKPLISMV
jgi:hypothetical protein